MIYSHHGVFSTRLPYPYAIMETGYVDLLYAFTVCTAPRLAWLQCTVKSSMRCV